MVDKKDALRKAINKCRRNEGHFERCLLTEGFKIEPIKSTKTKPLNFESRELGDMRRILRKLRRLR